MSSCEWALTQLPGGVLSTELHLRHGSRRQMAAVWIAAGVFITGVLVLFLLTIRN